jgi:hypothetical protein
VIIIKALTGAYRESERGAVAVTFAMEGGTSHQPEDSQAHGKCRGGLVLRLSRSGGHVCLPWSSFSGRSTCMDAPRRQANGIAMLVGLMCLRC